MIEKAREGTQEQRRREKDSPGDKGAKPGEDSGGLRRARANLEGQLRPPMRQFHCDLGVLVRFEKTKKNQVVQKLTIGA